MLRQLIIQTPIMPMVLISDGQQLVRSDFLYDEQSYLQYEDIKLETDAILTMAKEQLAEYFAGTRTKFKLPMLLTGTDFQHDVWAQLKAIPYGQTISYQQLAQIILRPKAARAVGGACRANPLLVIVPCHRVLATSGAYTGYAGDKIFVKEHLLRLEGGIR